MAESKTKYHAFTPEEIISNKKLADSKNIPLLKLERDEKSKNMPRYTLKVLKDVTKEGINYSNLILKVKNQTTCGQVYKVKYTTSKFGGYKKQLPFKSGSDSNKYTLKPTLSIQCDVSSTDENKRNFAMAILIIRDEFDRLPFTSIVSECITPIQSFINTDKRTEDGKIITEPIDIPIIRLTLPHNAETRVVTGVIYDINSSIRVPDPENPSNYKFKLVEFTPKQLSSEHINSTIKSGCSISCTVNMSGVYTAEALKNFVWSASTNYVRCTQPPPKDPMTYLSDDEIEDISKYAIDNEKKQSTTNDTESYSTDCYDGGDRCYDGDGGGDDYDREKNVVPTELDKSVDEIDASIKRKKDDTKSMNSKKTKY